MWCEQICHREHGGGRIHRHDHGGHPLDDNSSDDGGVLFVFFYV
jgi:hypothetical protein